MSNVTSRNVDIKAFAESVYRDGGPLAVLGIGEETRTALSSQDLPSEILAGKSAIERDCPPVEKLWA